MTRQSIVALSSGGKDSMIMLHRLMLDPDREVRALVSTVNETNGRVAMHGTRGDLLHAQAGALGLPLTLAGLPENCDNVTYETRLAQALAPFRAEGIAHVACGDLFLADIRRWREALFERLGWQPVFPIWHQPTERLARELAGPNWSLTVTCVDLEKLPESFLGRGFDRDFLADLPAGIDPCGENGEFHTFVHDGPDFSRPLAFATGEVVVTHQRFAMLDLRGV